VVKIKICGITNEKDAIWATNLGADYLGFNFYKLSPRKISPKLASEIIAKLPSFIQPVGVFVNEEMKTVLKIVKKCKLSLVQLHGEETPEYCNEFKVESSMPHRQVAGEATKFKVGIIKAFRIKEEKSLEVIPGYVDKVDYFLLDTHVEGVAGGSGEVFNWDLALRVKDYGKPVFLAGGLTPENVKEAITKVQPYAVDVASGVERLPRRKDYEKMKVFIQIVRSLRI